VSFPAMNRAGQIPAAYSHNLRECDVGAVEDYATCRGAVGVLKVRASTLSDRLTVICAAFQSSGQSRAV
jgi:hypothetical protein